MRPDPNRDLDLFRELLRRHRVSIFFENRDERLRSCVIEWAGWGPAGQIELIIGDECPCHENEEDLPDDAECAAPEYQCYNCACPIVNRRK